MAAIDAPAVRGVFEPSRRLGLSRRWSTFAAHTASGRVDLGPHVRRSRQASARRGREPPSPGQPGVERAPSPQGALPRSRRACGPEPPHEATWLPCGGGCSLRPRSWRLRRKPQASCSETRSVCPSRPDARQRQRGASSGVRISTFRSWPMTSPANRSSDIQKAPPCPPRAFRLALPRVNLPESLSVVQSSATTYRRTWFRTRLVRKLRGATINE